MSKTPDLEVYHNKRSWMRMNKVPIWLLVFLLFSVVGCFRPKPTGYTAEPIIMDNNPMQDQTTGSPFVIKVNDGVFTVTPMADYQAAVEVVGKNYYYTGWAGQLVPVDLALAWGDLTKPAVDKFISYSQSNRWYFYHYAAGCPVDQVYISSHSANNHIIPANRVVLQTIKSLNVKDKVKLTGYLVNIRGQSQGRECRWNTSLTRLDTGDGACELFYVKKVQIGEWIYE